MGSPVPLSPVQRYLQGSDMMPVDVPPINGSGVVHWNCYGLKFLREDLMRNKEFRKTKNFILNRNSLRTLPQNIHLLSQLVSLHIKGNELESLPDGIGGLKSLEILDVCSNCLQELPRSIGQLVNLKRLYVSSNKLRQLPKEIGELTELETLDSVNNHLIQVPLQLAKCGQLRRLALDGNQILEFPRQLCGFHNLQELSLSGNRLEWLPQGKGINPFNTKQLNGLFHADVTSRLIWICTVCKHCLYTDIGHQECLQHLYVDNNPGLAALPCSTEHLLHSIGFHRCGLADHEKQLDGHEISFTNKCNHPTQVSLPREIETVCHPDRNCVPSLVELGLRCTSLLWEGSIHTTQENFQHSKINLFQCSIIEELPKDLQETLRHPTGHCVTCNKKVFLSAFPVVFQDDVLFLGFCCSLQCVFNSEVPICCPLVHPYKGYIHPSFIF